MSENGIYINNIREHHCFVLNILSQHTELERVYIIIKNAAENILLNKKTRDYYYKYDTSAYNILLRILI